MAVILPCSKHFYQRFVYWMFQYTVLFTCLIFKIITINCTNFTQLLDTDIQRIFLFNVATVVLFPYSNRGGERRWPHNKTVHRHQATVHFSSDILPYLLCGHWSNTIFVRLRKSKLKNDETRNIFLIQSCTNAHSSLHLHSHGYLHNSI